MMRCRLLALCALALCVLAYIAGALLPTAPPPKDADVARLSAGFWDAVHRGGGLAVHSRGFFLRDRDTLFWKLFTDKFGANPNTPYMWSTLPLVGFLLPSPMWSLGPLDAVVLLARVPPKVEYFSFTTFALFMPRRGLPFSSLGDSVNNANIQHSTDGLFAHVVTANKRTFELVRSALVESGLPAHAINLRAVPSELGLFDDVVSLGGQARLGTHFEVVLRLFRFANQTEGDAYLASHPPVFYLRATHSELAPLEESRRPSYRSRVSDKSVREQPLAAEYDQHSRRVLSRVGEALEPAATAAAAHPFTSLQPLVFTPLLIKGLECLEKHTNCLGDCPDAAYFGPNVHAERDEIEMLSLRTDDELHLVTLVHHRQLNSSVYGSVALLKPHPTSAAVLSKARMSVRATPIGVTSFDFGDTQTSFVSWAFTRSQQLCDILTGAEGAGPVVDGCTVVDETDAPRDGYLTYCERVYLNPVTGTGPHWDDLLPARLYRIQLRAEFPPPPSGLPRALPLAQITDGSATMRFFHIIKTGGESLELHLAASTAPPRLNYSHCRRAALGTGWQANLTSIANGACAAAAAGVSSVLCAANCECCADDAHEAGGFNGVLIRSPRAHMLSLFTHCHTAHTQNTWGRALGDVTQYLAEIVLRSTEWACGSFGGVSFNSDWAGALREGVVTGDPEQERRMLRVLPLHNTQAHALTCSTARGSLGQHFRVLQGTAEGRVTGRGVSGPDSLRPRLSSAIASLHRFEWVGLTDLFEHSLCLLHFQAGGALPAECVCAADGLKLKLPRFTHGVKRHDPLSLSPELLSAIDEHTAVDAQLFAEALRLLLGRLRTVEEATGQELLKCVRWDKLWRATGHIPGLWAGPGAILGDSTKATDAQDGHAASAGGSSAPSGKAGSPSHDEL